MTITPTIASQAARRHRCQPRIIAACIAALIAVAHTAAAQSSGATAPATTVDAAAVPGDAADEEGVLNPAEPDIVVVNLPTTMLLAPLKGNFRLTHRFAGNLRRGSFGHQFSNIFGIDQGATIGFEFRIAVARHVQAAFYRSSFDKTIQFHGKYDAIRQRRSRLISVSALGSIEGTDNFQKKYAPAIGAVASRTVGSRLALYVTPLWIDNTAASLTPLEHDHDAPTSDDHDQARQSTTVIGAGGRVRVHGRTYIAAEIVPRVAGYAPDEPSYGVSIEKRVGGHMFSLTVTNSFGTTFAQVARGGAAHTLFLGFNLGRKFE